MSWDDPLPDATIQRIAGTNIPELVLRCDACGHTEPCPVALTQPWPVHCAVDMRLANTFDRDGRAIA
jgi:hypothetical protein